MDPLLVEPCVARESEGVDAVERRGREPRATRRSMASTAVGIGGLAQDREMGDGFVHAEPPGGRNGR